MQDTDNENKRPRIKPEIAAAWAILCVIPFTTFTRFGFLLGEEMTYKVTGTMLLVAFSVSLYYRILSHVMPHAMKTEDTRYFIARHTLKPSGGLPPMQTAFGIISLLLFILVNETLASIAWLTTSYALYTLDEVVYENAENTRRDDTEK